MGLRKQVGNGLESTLGKERTDGVRQFERRVRRRLADRLAPPPPPRPAKQAAKNQQPAKKRPPTAAKPRPLGEPNDRQGGWIPSDPFVPHPQPRLTRHDLLRGLHSALAPRTYFEIGVNEGSSLTLSRTKSIAVDPEFAVKKTLHCDLDLVQAKSDEFFTRADGFDHFDGLPIDLAFIDGMHLSEFALRDFINVEKHLATTAVTVFDDVLPRNPLEAARIRLTGSWAGDVYKAVETISRHRDDLLVLLVNTWPTGTAVVIGADPSSSLLGDVYESEVPYLEAIDPQKPPQEYMARTAAVDPEVLLASEAWSLLVRARETGDSATFDEAKAVLRSLPTLGEHSTPTSRG